MDLRRDNHLRLLAGTVGEPEDMAQAVLYLTREGAGFITGADVVIDGEMTVKMIYEE